MGGDISNERQASSHRDLAERAEYCSGYAESPPGPNDVLER